MRFISNTSRVLKSILIFFNKYYFRDKKLFKGRGIRKKNDSTLRNEIGELTSQFICFVESTNYRTWILDGT